MTKVFHIVPMNGTPFGTSDNGHFELYGKKFLKSFGIEKTTKLGEADLLLTRLWPLNIKYIIKYRLKDFKKKPILVWTHEPRECVLTKYFFKRTWLVPDVHVMDIYTKDVYLNNFSFYSFAIRRLIKNIEKSDLKKFNGKPIAAFISYLDDKNDRKLFIEGVNIDLTVMRQNIAIEGYQRGLLDIYGRNWPHGMASIENKISDRAESKIANLKPYKFNLCLENTNFDYYCTEKIWESIQGQCLPIYYGKGNKIYDIFPTNSFIDVSSYKDLNQMFDHLKNMSDDEYLSRLNKCIDIFNSFLKTDSFLNHFEKTITCTANKIIDISNAHKKYP